MNYKVGDVVETIVYDANYTGLERGTLLEIQEADGHMVTAVELSKKNSSDAIPWWFSTDNLRLKHLDVNFNNSQQHVELRIKKLSDKAVIPTYAKDGDAAMDLTAISHEWDNDRMVHVYGTGIAMEIPEGYVGMIFQRSSVYKTNVMLSNCVGVIDSGYRGEIKAVFRPFIAHPSAEPYSVWDRIMQIIIMPFPKVVVKEVTELSSTDRGSGGFGSTGR